MGIVETTQNFQLALHLFKNSKLADLLLIQDLDSDLVPRLLMKGHPNFSKCTISQVFREPVLPDAYFVYRH